jgi:quaternary ammonium compound-resistance protein SugE
VSEWTYLILAGILEIGFASMIKLTENFTKVLPTIGFLIFAIGSFYMLTKAIEHIPIGTAYAVWTGIGTAGAIIVGIVLYHDPVSALRIFFLCTLVGSIIGLKLVS